MSNTRASDRSGPQRATDHYDLDAAWTADKWDDTQLERLRATASLIPANSRNVLDVGCGIGMLGRLSSSELRITSVDIAMTALREAQAPKVQANAVSLPFRDGAYEVIIAGEMIEHLSKPVRDAVLTEFARVARDYIVLTVPNREVLEESHVLCEDCGTIFHQWHHTMSYKIKDVLMLRIPSFQPMSTRFIGNRRRPPSRVAVRLSQALGHYAVPPVAVCPACGNDSRFRTRRSVVSRLLREAPRRVQRPLEGRWIAAIFRRESLDEAPSSPHV